MKKIRIGTFETNSSSTHSITMCMKDDYKKFKNGEMYLYDEKLITPQEKDLIIRKEIFESQIEIDWNNETITFEGNTIKYEDYDDRKRKIEDLCTQERLNSITKEEVNNFDESEIGIYNYEQYEDDEYLETFKEEYTTPNGDVIVAFGKYGNDY